MVNDLLNQGFKKKMYLHLYEGKSLFFSRHFFFESGWVFFCLILSGLRINIADMVNLQGEREMLSEVEEWD